MQQTKQLVHTLLKKSERIFKTDMVYLAKGGFWLTFGQIMSAFSSFLLALIFANFLPKEIYGTYKYVLAIASVLTLTTLSGMNTAILQATVLDHKNALIPALKTEMKWGLIGGFAGLLFALYYFSVHNTTLAISFCIVAVFIPLMDSLNIYDAVLQGKKLFKTSSTYWMLSQTVATIALITAVFFIHSVFAIVLAYFLSWTLMRTIFIMRTMKEMDIGPGDAEDKKYVERGKHLSFVEITKTIAAQIDQILVFHYLGAAQLATYALAVAMPNQITAITKNVSILALPKIVEKSNADVKKNILKKMLIMGTCTAAIAVVYILAAPFLFKILFPRYIDSIFYSQIFAISMIGTVSVLSTVTLQMKATAKQLVALNTYDSILEIGTIVVFVYFFGLLGVVIARVINKFIYLGLSLLTLRKI